MHNSRRHTLRWIGVTATSGLAGCVDVGGGDGEDEDGGANANDGGELVEPPQVSFDFRYDPDGGTGGGSLRVTHAGGDPVAADPLSLTCSDGDEARWHELGSTQTGPDGDVTAGDSATLDGTVAGWGSDVTPGETVTVVHEGETAVVLAEYTPSTPTSVQATPRPDAVGPKVSDWSVPSTATAGADLSASARLEQLYQDPEWPSWTLQGRTELRTPTWTVTLRDQSGATLARRSFDDTAFQQGEISADGEFGAVASIDVTLRGTAPDPDGRGSFLMVGLDQQREGETHPIARWYTGYE